MKNRYYYRVHVRKLVDGDELAMEPHVEVMLANGERFTAKTLTTKEGVKDAMRKLCSEADVWIQEHSDKN